MGPLHNLINLEPIVNRKHQYQVWHGNTVKISWDVDGIVSWDGAGKGLIVGTMVETWVSTKADNRHYTETVSAKKESNIKTEAYYCTDRNIVSTIIEDSIGGQAEPLTYFLAGPGISITNCFCTRAEETDGSSTKGESWNTDTKQTI